MNPGRLNAMGLGLEDVRKMLAAANVNRPKGQISDDRFSRSLAATDQLFKAEHYEPLVVPTRTGAGSAVGYCRGDRLGGRYPHRRSANGKPAVSLLSSASPVPTSFPLSIRLGL